jgi:hypothetical protein
MTTIARAFRMAAICAAIGTFSSISSAAAFTEGNVFVSTGAGTVLEYTPTGTLVQTLTPGTGYITGSAFDASGNFYVTRFTNNSVQKFSSSGTDLGTFGSGYSTPESVVIDGTGAVYVGSTGNGIRKFDSAGSLLSTPYSGRVDFMDLSSDQTTMLFTTEGGEVNRVDVSTGTVLSVFSTAVENAFALRIRSNGTVLVADGADIELLDASGNQIGTYDEGSFGSWFGLNLDPDGTSFWSADFSGHIAHFDIATGDVIASWSVPSVGGTWGLAVFGEATAGCPTCGGDDGTIPEPAPLSLVGLSLLALALIRRRQT